MIVPRTQKDVAVTGTSTQPSTIIIAERIESHRRRDGTGPAGGALPEVVPDVVSEVVSVPVPVAGGVAAGVAAVAVVGTGTVSPLELMPPASSPGGMPGLTLAV